MAPSGQTRRRKSSDGFGLTRSIDGEEDDKLRRRTSPSRLLLGLSMIAGALLIFLFVRFVKRSDEANRSTAHTKETAATQAQIVHVCGAFIKELNGVYEEHGLSNGKPFFTRPTPQDNEHRWVLHTHQEPEDATYLWYLTEFKSAEKYTMYYRRVIYHARTMWTSYFHPACVLCY